MPAAAAISPTSCAMAVMGKESIPGRAKTRLVPPLIAEEAALLNTAFLQDIVGNLYEARRQADIVPYVAYGPAGSESFFRDHLPAGVGLIESSLPDFGQCLHRAIETMLDAGHGSACVVNSDSPTMPTGFLVEAARILAAPGERAVLGPCMDGGYYLLGLKHAYRELFEEIDWSTERVREQTERRARRLGLALVSLDPWYDVDDAAALRRVCGELLDGAGAGAPGADRGIYAAPRTRAALTRLLARNALAGRLDIGASRNAAPLA